MTVRPFTDTDFPALAAFMRRVKDDARDEAAWREADRSDRPSQFTRLVAERGGTLAGWGQAWLHRQARPGTFRLAIHADPAADPNLTRRALFDRLLQAAAASGAAAIQAEVAETDVGALELFRDNGFMESNREWESVLDVERFDFSPYEDTERHVAEQGITIATLAEERKRTTDHDALHRAVHAMEVTCARDDPSNDEDDRGLPYERYLKVILPTIVVDGYFLAKDGERYVGVSNFFHSPSEPGRLKQGLTGVLPAYRRRGIAIALKVRTIRYAREHGYQTISTRNNTQNAPMLAINERLGFQKLPAWITLERTLA